MTRINTCDVDELSLPHTRGEYKEITRVFTGTINCIESKGSIIKAYKYIKRVQPSKYTVQTKDNPQGGQGHEMFFRDKLSYIEDRYIALALRLEREGTRINWDMVQSVIDNAHEIIVDKRFWNNYTPDLEAYELNKKRRIEMGDTQYG